MSDADEYATKLFKRAQVDHHRSCTCHPSEAPTPCQRKYAFSECQAAALQAAALDILAITHEIARS